MNRKGLAILMRTRIRPSTGMTPPTSPLPSDESSHGQSKLATEGLEQVAGELPVREPESPTNQERIVKAVQESMHTAITMNKTEMMDAILDNFAQGYFSLSNEGREKLLLVLAREYDVDRTRVHELMQQYLGLKFPSGEVGQKSVPDDEALLAAFYRTERSLRQALSPMYEILFERLNKHTGGLKFLCLLRADLLSILRVENISSLRALDSYLKEKLATWLSPAALELHQITWDDSASLLEKIVAYEAVHPINNLLDLKRRLGVGRRCFGYLHPAIPGEPLIFIEVALMKDVAQKIQEVLWDDPPTHESEATCALFYSISSTQPGLAGINLGKFLIKRAINLVKRDMPHIITFATLSPIPGFMQWLVSKLISQTKLAESESNDMTDAAKMKSGSSLRENILHQEEEEKILESSKEFSIGTTAIVVLLNLLTSTKCEWVHSDEQLNALERPLMRLCARYLLQEKKRGKALDPVGNFHLQNGAMVGRLNWMADHSVKGLSQSGGIMVNYIYKVDNIEENAQAYFSTGHIEASPEVRQYIQEQRGL